MRKSTTGIIAAGIAIVAIGIITVWSTTSFDNFSKVNTGIPSGDKDTSVQMSDTVSTQVTKSPIDETTDAQSFEVNLQDGVTATSTP